MSQWRYTAGGHAKWTDTPTDATISRPCGKTKKQNAKENVLA